MGKNTKERTAVRDFQESIAKEGQSEWGSQDGTARRTGRTRGAGQESQDGTARTEMTGKERTVRTGQLERCNHDGQGSRDMKIIIGQLNRKGSSGQDSQNRKVMRGQPE